MACAQGTDVTLDWESVRRELDDKGYTVIDGVLSRDECDLYVSQYQDWLAQFDENEAPFSMHSLIQRYRIGHFEPTWNVRLKLKPIFAKLWKTTKLMSSIDAVAIGEPPEKTGDHSFAKPDKNWLHVDQCSARSGLHAFQSGVYLEETTETDWCFRVMEGSHKYHEEFFKRHTIYGQDSDEDFRKLKRYEVDWFKEKHCTLKKVPVPKGGIVLWDSRLIHDSVRPEHGRSHTDRWRFVVFISMTPAIWANQEDMSKKREAYKRLFMTTHWASQGVHFFADKTSDFPWKRIKTVDVLPSPACTTEAKQLAGVESYDFEDGQPNGEDLKPKWTRGCYSSK